MNVSSFNQIGIGRCHVAIRITESERIVCHIDLSGRLLFDRRTCSIGRVTMDSVRFVSSISTFQEDPKRTSCPSNNKKKSNRSTNKLFSSRKTNLTGNLMIKLFRRSCLNHRWTNSIVRVVFLDKEREECRSMISRCSVFWSSRVRFRKT